MFSIVLSAPARNAVRALVRGHPDFDGFCRDIGMGESRDMNKDQLMALIEKMGLEQEVTDLVARINSQPVPAKTFAQVVADAETSRDVSGKADAAIARINAEVDMRDSVLDEIRPFVSPTLLNKVNAALSPLVEAALKPAVTIDRTVHVDADGNIIIPPTPAVLPACRTGKATLGKLFDFRGNYAKNEVTLWNAADAPAIDPYYVAEPPVLAKFAATTERNRLIWLAGPSGTGKTTLPTQYAARTGRPFLRLAMDRATEPTDMFGMLGLDGKGGMAWRDGKLTAAIRKPGTIILIDEITACPAGIAMVLQTLLDERYLTLPTGERVGCADGVTFCAGDNTFGFGDETGVYSGTAQANAALVDRFAVMVAVDYLPAALEAEALSNRSGAPLDASRCVVDFVNGARKLPGFDARPLSLRRMVAFVGLVQDGFGTVDAFTDTFLTRLPETERQTLMMHYKAAFAGPVTETFINALKGINPVPVQPQSDRPEQVAARTGFDPVDDMN